MFEQPREQVIRLACEGDQHAWQELVHRHVRLVWAVARSYRLDHADAADVTQNTWLSLAEHLAGLREPARVASWLVTTARREALRVLALRRREAALQQREFASPSAGPEDVVLTADRDRALWRAFAALSERCQRMLRLLAFAPDLDYADIAAALGVSAGSVGPMRGRCLRELRRRFAAVGGVEEVAR